MKTALIPVALSVLIAAAPSWARKPAPAAGAPAAKEPAPNKPAVDSDVVREKLKAFHEAYKTPDESARVAAVDQLGGIDAPEAREILAGLLTVDVDAVRVKAAKLLKAAKDPRTLPALQEAVFNPVNLKHDKVRGAIADAMGEFNDPGLYDTWVKLLDAEDEPAVEAAKALGRLKAPGAIEPLLHEWGNCQNYTYSTKGRSGKHHTRVNAALKKRHDALAGPIDKALSEITGENHGSYGAWEEWWKKKKSGR